MANALIEVPRETTRAAMWAMGEGGRAARSVGGDLLHRVQPGHIPPEIVAQQAIIRKFEGRFGVVDLLDTDPDDGVMEVEAYMAADALVDEDVVDEDTIVELRPVLPADTLWDPVMNERRERAVHLLQHALEEEHNVLAIPSTHPIMPTSTLDSPVDSRTAWSAFTPELEGLHRQLANEAGYNPAMLGISGMRYDRALFGGHIATLDGDQNRDGILVLDHVGDRPADNRLVLHG